MNKKVLTICTDNSALSILAQAILSKHLQNIDVFSAGIRPKIINPDIKKALIKDNSWSDEFKAKALEDLIDQAYDLVIILSDKVKLSATAFSSATSVIQIDYDDCDYNNSAEVDRLIKTMKMELIPITRNELE